MRGHHHAGWRIEEIIWGVDLPFSDGDDIDPSVARRLAGQTEAPGEAPLVLNGLRTAMQRIDEARMTGAQLASDPI